jgi:hypothetical protein
MPAHRANVPTQGASIVVIAADRSERDQVRFAHALNVVLVRLVQDQRLPVIDAALCARRTDYEIHQLAAAKAVKLELHNGRAKFWPAPAAAIDRCVTRMQRHVAQNNASCL